MPYEKKFDLTIHRPLTLAQRTAEWVAGTVGSWKFIIGQSIVIVIWLLLNAFGPFHWDPYPFILLNLMLSFQAAYTAPMILMAHNRQNEFDRQVLYNEFELEEETRIEIDELHKKLDYIIERLDSENKGSK